MPKGRGSKKKGGAQRRNSSLGDHRRHKKTLTPPMLQLPNIVMTSWTQEGLPECIWIAAVSKETHKRAAAHGPLDILDQFVPDGERDVLDGRISRFSLIPIDRRPEARAALREQAPYGLPEGLGHALDQYPDCPAGWLFEDWITENQADLEVGVAYLAELVKPMIPSRDSHSAELRLMVLARLAKAGKLQMAHDLETAELIGKYPTYLDNEDQAKVESFVRATWNTVAISDDGVVEAPEWSRYFWRRSFEISPCQSDEGRVDLDDLGDIAEEEEIPEGDEAGLLEKEPTLADLRRAFADAVTQLGNELRKLQTDATLDTFDPATDEVKLGLASRAFRLLRSFLFTPLWWSNEMAPHLIRSLVDERIVAAWLLKRDDPQLFQVFKDYGSGKRKLYKLKLEEVMDTEDGGREDDDSDKLHARLEAEVNQDTMEEFLKIDLGGSFSGKSIREMAIEAELSDLYSLSYQPLSTEAHGEWGSLVMFDLNHCGNPLHLYHRLGAFDVDQQGYVHVGWARAAIDLAESNIAEIFESLGLDAFPAFDRFHEAIAAALREAPAEKDAEP